MQSLVVYGRFLARAVFSGVNTEFAHQWNGSANSSSFASQHHDLHLVTAACGVSKNHSPAQVLKKWSFGDDACFVAGHSLADVIGK